jgi:hypothetical protein
MANAYLIMNQIDTDHEFFVWGSGQDLKRFNGSGWDYYNYQNSAVPSGAPYFLDTRCISIDPEDRVWVGCAQGPTSGLNETAVFYIDSDNVLIGESWAFSDLGTFDVPQEISHIYACPFGDDILAFSTPLNGFGGTGATSSYTEFRGVTGGRLFYYLIGTNEWRETATEYTWPHIYDIKASGYDGKDYFYYVGTNDGLILIPQGRLETVELEGGVKIIKQAQYYNTKTSGIISDYIYSLDLDENNNLWIGTDNGLSFFDGTQFWNYPINSGPVTKVKARRNGHVFYSVGDGELNEGTGLWHFNGVNHTQYTSANSNLNNNNVLDIKLVESNITQSNLTIYENGLWVLCYNDLVSFNYDQPHVYGSSKYEGATGWNFTYFSATGATSAPLPKVNRYTWEYPEWQVYQTDYLQYKFPGLDPRNLFLTTKLSDIANGKAGSQPYWDNWPIPSYDDEILTQNISLPKWASEISITQNQTNPTYFGFLEITSSTSIRTLSGLKYYIGGYIKGDVTVNFGNYNNNDAATLININPTIGGSVTNTSVSGLSSLYSGEMGFIVSYNEAGYVDSILPFRGYQTRIQDLAASEDGEYLVASGIFDRFIENGPYVWDSLESENYTYRSGPTGAPAGVTTINVDGLTGGTYSWIYGSTGSTIINSKWTYLSGDLGQSSGNVDFGFNSSSTWEELNAVYLNYNNTFLALQTLNNIVSSNSINLSSGGSSVLYRVDYIENLPNAPKGVKLGVSYSYQYSGSTGAFSFSSGNSIDIIVYDSSNSTYPLVREVSSVTNYWDNYDVDTKSVFVAKIGRDLGNTISFTDLGLTGGFSYDVTKSYRGLAFRHFPSKYELDSNYSNPKSTKIDLTRYSINLSVESTPTFSLLTNTADLSTLKNKWNRDNDYFSVSEEILGSTQEISQNWLFDSVLGYVRMSSDDLTLFSTKTSESIYPGVGSTGSNRMISDIKSLPNNNTSLITGVSDQNFNFGGIGVTGISSTYTPYYIILDKDGNGVTGAFITGATGQYLYPKTSKDSSTYYVTTVFGASGSYFGDFYDAGATGSTASHFLTARITEQGVPLSMDSFSSPISSSDISLIESSDLGGNQYFVSYREIGATSDSLYLIKTNKNDKINDSESLSVTAINPYTGNFGVIVNIDPSDNIMISGFNYGVTGYGYYEYGATSGSFILSEQYVPELGINLGNIISRPGSGAWTWCDVHSTDKGMIIPLLSTVIFSNYASNIYGKQNNKWILSNSRTGNELLNVTGTPYFIYTFSESGNYTIYNSVEDSFGNVYATTRPGYIEVTDHKIKRPDDKNPDVVDSFDYGQPEPFAGRDYQAQKLAKDLIIEQERIFKSGIQPFGSQVDIPDNPDATFRSE